MIKYSFLGKPVVKYLVEQFKFPAGEVGVRLPSLSSVRGDIKMDIILKNSDDIMAMLLAVDAIKRQHNPKEIRASIKYLPYARQDRVCSDGESLSAVVMASLINSCGFSEVLILDPHSDVMPALIHNVVIQKQYSYFQSLKTSWYDIFIVAPDAGAYKKCLDFAKRVGAAGVITCNKERDVRSGKILGMKCDEDFEGKNLFVLDDICDGGRTFIELSALLRSKAKSLELAVTHGIFSKGVKVVADCYDRVYTTNSYHGEVSEDMKYNNVYWEEVFN